jgi:hypothetical protein
MHIFIIMKVCRVIRGSCLLGLSIARLAGLGKGGSDLCQAFGEVKTNSFAAERGAAAIFSTCWMLDSEQFCCCRP